MDGKMNIAQALILRGNCDLTGRPCLPGIHVIQSLGQATSRAGDALPADFRLEAQIEVSACKRVCLLSLKAESGAITVGRGDVLLAECTGQMPAAGGMRQAELAETTQAALARRVH